MTWYRKKPFAAAAGSVVSCLRTLLGRSRQDPARVVPGSDKICLAAKTDQAPRTVDTSVNGETKLQPPGAASLVQPLLPPECHKLNSEDIVILGEHPARAGTFTDVWDGSLDGSSVVIKSYRLCSTVNPEHPRMRLYKEALACSMLFHRNIVSFRAVYTTPEHPLALVYDFMPHRCLREYVNGNNGAKRIRLLADIARGLFHMHDLGIIHGNLTINNILVGPDDAARIAGLGSALVSRQKDHMWSEIDEEILSYGTAPELVRPTKSRIQKSKKSDIYAFALLAWELFAGNVPFPHIHLLGAIYPLATGDRPPRPSHPELSDKLWEMIERCWDNDPLSRPPIKTVVDILEEEISWNGCA